MDPVTLLNPAIACAALLTLAPLFLAGFFAESACRRLQALPLAVQLAAPAVLCVPYALVSAANGMFHWAWLFVYALFPVALAALLEHGKRHDNGWRELLVLAVLGLTVDLRWLESAWPAHLSVFNKMLLLDAGLYGFTVLRQLDGVGFDLHLRTRDASVGLRELAAYTPLALALGLGLGFLHVHLHWPGLTAIAAAWCFTFVFIAIPEELFFRGWLQNLLERRLGRIPALLLASLLFGLAHFNKRAAHFNWRYVLLAAVAGVFYGRAWRRQRRVGAAAITHASVDAIWSLWLR
jgi:membrane protease YdiL (CAAX protease family)